MSSKFDSFDESDAHGMGETACHERNPGGGRWIYWSTIDANDVNQQPVGSYMEKINADDLDDVLNTLDASFFLPNCQITGVGGDRDTCWVAVRDDDESGRFWIYELDGGTLSIRRRFDGDKLQVPKSKYVCVGGTTDIIFFTTNGDSGNVKWVARFRRPNEDIGEEPDKLYLVDFAIEGRRMSPPADPGGIEGNDAFVWFNEPAIQEDDEFWRRGSRYPFNAMNPNYRHTPELVAAYGIAGGSIADEDGLYDVYVTCGREGIGGRWLMHLKVDLSAGTWSKKQARLMLDATKRDDCGGKRLG